MDSHDLPSAVQTSEPTAYLVCGFIGAGKTTFARELEAKTGAIRITKDEWLVSIFGRGIAKAPEFSVYDEAVTALATDIAFRILKAGADVILDEGFWTRNHREEMFRKVAEIGAKPVLYFVDCPVDVMRQRVIDRNNLSSVDSFVIDVEMFDRYLQQWEAPTAGETYLLPE